MTAPLSEGERAAIEAHHYRANPAHPDRCVDGQPWPCEAATLLAALVAAEARAKALADALADALPLTINPSPQSTPEHRAAIEAADAALAAYREVGG